MGKINDLTGKTFNCLKVLEFAYLDKEIGLAFWKFKCNCGNETIKCGLWVRQEKIKSCGCMQYKNNINNLKNKRKPRNEETYLNGKKHPAYVTWTGMKRRCYQPNCKEYRWYGAKGIKVCEEWLNDAANFINWAKNNGYEKGLCIDRIDVKGDYTPTNCHFITKVQNLKKIRNDNLKNDFQYSRNRKPSAYVSL